MPQKFKKIWHLAKPYLKKGKRKDFVLHTEGVVKAMKMLLKKEDGEEDILIPAAIVHDVGWAKVPLKLQRSNHKKEQIRALNLHLKYALPIIEKIFKKVGYPSRQIKKIIEIVLAHKFKKPKDFHKRLLIDADTLSDVFKEQFQSDIKAYKTTTRELYKFRKNNQFYNKTARVIFKKELAQRRREFENNKS